MLIPSALEMAVFTSVLCGLVLLCSSLSVHVSALDPEVDYDAVSREYHRNKSC